MAWKCPECAEQVDDRFDRCWKCGTTPDGIRDPDSRTAADFEPPIPGEKPQFSLAAMLKMLTASALMFAMAATVRAETRDAFTLALSLVLGTLGAIFATLAIVTWILPTYVHRWQQRIRDEAGDHRRQ